VRHRVASVLQQQQQQQLLLLLVQRRRLARLAARQPALAPAPP
jgi:hypothetical protein